MGDIYNLNSGDKQQSKEKIVEEILQEFLAVHKENELTDMIVIAYKGRELFVRSSKMTRAEANFIIDKVKLDSIFEYN